jgi:hypothetical protein
LVSPLYPDKPNEPGYGQLYIADPAETSTERLANQSHQEFVAETVQRLDEMPLQVNPFAESHKRIHQMK